MTIHLFGAVFGLVVCKFHTNEASSVHADNTPAYSNDVFSLAGTLFLWIMWPSFNAAVAREGPGELRAITNTFLSITASTVGAFLVSRLINPVRWKFDVMHIQNSTLAGGVAMGVCADLFVTLGGALASGFVIGCVSVAGYVYLTPWLTKKGIQDICGVANLHGVPGFLGSVVAVFVTLGAKNHKNVYGTLYNSYFPRGDNQAGYQAAGIIVTIGTAIVGGLLCGFLMKQTVKINGISSDNYFNDSEFWHVPNNYNQENTIQNFEHVEMDTRPPPQPMKIIEF